jgi:hypothetical protein
LTTEPAAAFQSSSPSAILFGPFPYHFADTAILFFLLIHK